MNYEIVATPPGFEPGYVEAMPQFTSGDDINPETTRYLFFPGDIIGIRRKQEMKGLHAIGITQDGGPFAILQNGGHEVGSACLVRTKGFLPRAFITPLEVGAFWTPPELLPPGYPAFSGVYDQNGKGAKYLVGEKKYPGEAIHWILSSSQNEQGMRLGAVELTTLRGQKWEDVKDLQKIFFRDYPKLPVKLGDLELQIRAAPSQDPDARMIREQMLFACEEFRDWGLTKLAIEHNLVKIGTLAEGWTYSYSDLARALMEQLDITPQDQQFQSVAKIQEEMARSTAALLDKANKDSQSEILEKMMQTQNQVVAALALIADKLATPATPSAQPNQNKKS